MSKSRRHHFLPVFLLRRFALPEGGRVPRVRVLRPERAFETSVHNVGLERDFHTDTPLLMDPEQTLSREEGQIAAELARWKVGDLDERGSAVADKLAFHLRLRSKSMRRLGHQLMETLVTDSSQEVAGALASSRPDSSLQREVAAVLQEAADAGRHGTWTVEAATVLERRLKSTLESHLSHGVVFEAARIWQVAMQEGFFAEVVAGTHTTIILATLLNHRKRAAFGDRPWAIAKPDAPLLLGDVGPLALYEESGLLRPLNLTSAPIRALYLPVAPRMLLACWHGRRPKVPSARVLNEATVRLSHDLAVGNVPLSSLERLRPLLATRSGEDAAAVVLGLNAPSSAPIVADIAAAITAWAKERVDLHWSRPQENRYVANLGTSPSGHGLSLPHSLTPRPGLPAAPVGPPSQSNVDPATGSSATDSDISDRSV